MKRSEGDSGAVTSGVSVFSDGRLNSIEGADRGNGAVAAGEHTADDSDMTGPGQWHSLAEGGRQPAGATERVRGTCAAGWAQVTQRGILGGGRRGKQRSAWHAKVLH